MLCRSVHLDLHREGVIFSENILHGVDVVLTHIAQATAIIIPIATEGLMHTVRIIRLIRSRAEPHVVVEFLRNRLRFEVLLAGPVEFPCEASGSRDPDGERPAENSAVHEFLQRLDSGSKTVEGVLEAEPGVQSEYSSVFLDCIDNLLAFPDGSGHRFLAENVLSGLAGFHGHDSMPV